MLSEQMMLIPRRIRNIQNPFEFFAQTAEEAIRSYKAGRISEIEAERRLVEIESWAKELKDRIFN